MNAAESLKKIVEGITEREEEAFKKYLGTMAPNKKLIAMLERDIAKLITTLAAFTLTWGIPIKLSLDKDNSLQPSKDKE